ncbi:hypothetical protein QL285_064746 [Trifolium repens]|nr:hypothetical protein QL285_064746 [Trifolium repens]
MKIADPSLNSTDELRSVVESGAQIERVQLSYYLSNMPSSHCLSTAREIKIWQLTGIEKDYPQKNPPHMLMLHQESSECFSNGPVPIFISPKSFMHTLEKSLNPADVGSGVLTLTWNGFCKIALPNENSEITMVDWLGYIWKCHLEIDEHPEKNCKITGEWRNFCRAHRLSNGVTVKFGVTDTTRNLTYSDGENP